MVFDQGGNFLYIGTSDGFVRRFNITNGVLDLSYNLGGSLNGMDISSDGSFLLVAQGTGNVFQRLALASGMVTNIGYSPAFGESNAWDVAIASNGLALVTTRYSGSGSVPLRQIDLSNNAIGVRSDAPGAGPNGNVGQDTYLYRSTDRSRLYLLQSNLSSGPVFTYSSATNTFGTSANTGSSIGGAAAVNRTGSIVATGLGARAALDAVPAFNFLRSLQGANAGVAFDGLTDRLYATNTSIASVVAYDSSSGAELFRMPVGEAVPLFSPFDTGLLVASPDGHYLAIATASGVRLLTIPTQPPPPPNPTFGTPRDFVFDHVGSYLYIGTAEGLVWPYRLADGVLGTPYNLGGSLNGMDLAPDDTFLLVAQQDTGVAQGAFQQLDLATGTMTNFDYPRDFGEGGAWDVAVGSNGLALGSTDYLGSGNTQLRQISTATGAINARRSVGQRTQIHRSADNTRMYLLEGNASNGPVFTYSAVSDTFGPNVSKNISLNNASAAVNRNGTLLATRVFNTSATLETAPDFGFVRTFDPLTSGVAFDAVQDVVYGISPYLSQIIAYDTNTFAERFRFDIGENFSSGITQFGRGALVASNDGRYLALNTGTAVRVYGVPAAQLLSVASIKNHAGIPFGIALPLDGPRAIESRSGGANGQYTVVFTFGQSLVSVAGAAVTNGTGAVASASIDAADASKYIVNLTGVSNHQTVKITLSGVGDAAGNQTALISAQMGVLLGDTNGNGTVNASDISETKARSGQPVSGANFRSDVNVSGTINASDIALVKGQAGSSLPAAGDQKEGSARLQPRPKS